MLPDSIKNKITKLTGLSISKTESVSGGSINQALKLYSDTGVYFLKWNAAVPDDFFQKEAEGLKLLKNANSGVRIPEVAHAESSGVDNPGFLLMEWITSERSGDSFKFGAQLAKLHNNHAETFGLQHDNYIGSLPQSNRQHKKWLTFFANERIAPQLKLAIDSGKLGSSIQKHWFGLLKRLDSIIPPVVPSLLHGDLWGGNYMFDQDGNAVLIDPAVYYGHPENDLAFTKMFGGFDSDFYEGYRSITQIEPDFNDRIQVYNLYPLLVHVNLFGGHYTDECRRFLKKF